MEKIGLLGCGHMGQCMVKALVANDYDVVVFDNSASAIEAAVKIGARAVSNGREMAMEAETILICLPASQHIESALFDECGIYGALTSNHIIIDTSTVDPSSTRKNYGKVAEKQARYLDCPILGRPSNCGRWLMPAGGDIETFEKVKPILSCFSSDARFVGPSGTGNAIKLLNQMMFTCINAVTSEVLAICGMIGIDKGVFYETVASSGAATVCGLFKETGKMIVNEDFTHPNFTVDLMIKDTKLGLQMAKQANAPSVIAGYIEMYNEIASANGFGNEDTSALYKVFKRHYSNENTKENLQ